MASPPSYQPAGIAGGDGPRLDYGHYQGGHYASPSKQPGHGYSQSVHQSIQGGGMLKQNNPFERQRASMQDVDRYSLNRGISGL